MMFVFFSGTPKPTTQLTNHQVLKSFMAESGLEPR